MMHASLLIVGLALTQTAPPASVAPSVPTPKKPGVVVERVESTVAGIVAQGTEIRRLAEGQLFTEGPACDAAGVLYWTDIPRNELMRLAPDGKPEVALEKTEGLNGLAFASDGTLYGCAGGSGRIVKIDLAAKSMSTVCDARLDDTPLGRVNDLCIAKDGTISHPEIVNSSGNPLMDQSVLDAARKVQQIDPLPQGLSEGDFFELKINFKLDQTQ